MFYSSTASYFDTNLILKPIFDDLALLEDGVELEILGNVQNLYGTLVAIVADNLASKRRTRQTMPNIVK